MPISVVKLEIRSLSDRECKLLVEGVNPYFVNALRRTLLSEVPKLAIDKVGIKAIRHPVRITERGSTERSPKVQHTIALFNMYVGLPHHFKGTHMSRFVEILNAHEREITVETFQVMLEEMVQKLEAEEGRIEMSFSYFVDKAAQATLVGDVFDDAATGQGLLNFFARGLSAGALTMVAESAPRDRTAYAIGTVQTAQRLGPALGPVIGGLVAQAVGLRNAFLVTSGFYVAILDAARDLVVAHA